MFDKGKIENAVLEILKEQIMNPDISEKVTLDSDVEKEFGLDSLDLIEIVMQCEEEFDIAIDDEKIDRCKTGNDIVKAIITEKERLKKRRINTDGK